MLGDWIESGGELVQHEKLSGLEEDARHNDLLPVRQSRATLISEHGK